jgi:hypothetical protein
VGQALLTYILLQHGCAQPAVAGWEAWKPVLQGTAWLVPNRLLRFAALLVCCSSQQLFVGEAGGSTGEDSGAVRAVSYVKLFDGKAVSSSCGV